MADRPEDINAIIAQFLERMSLLAEFMMSFPGFIAIVIILEDNVDNHTEINRLAKGFIEKREAIARWHKQADKPLDPRAVIMMEWLTLFKNYQVGSFGDEAFVTKLDSVLTRLEKMEVEFENKQGENPEN
jgi:hypothetical protein